MKRGFVAVAVASVLALGFLPAASQDAPVIPVGGYWDETKNPSRVDEGSPCEVVGPFGFPRQVIVRNESDTIIAAWSIEGTWEFPEGRDFLACTWSKEVPVPEATFYTVYLDEQRLTTVNASDFPLGPDNDIEFTIPGD